MRIGISAALIACLSASSLQAQTGWLDRSIIRAGDTLRYQVYVPAEYSPSRTWPVIVALHGTGPQGTDGMRQTNSDFANNVRRRRELFPAVMVFPQAQRGQGFAPQGHDMIIPELDRTMEEFRGDSARVYLVGFSMGAVEAYRIAFTWPDRFAAVVAVSGSVTLSDRLPPALVERDQRENPFGAYSQAHATMAARLKGVPVWIFHGEKDIIAPLAEARLTRDALQQAGGTVRFTEYPDTGHPDAARKAFADPALIEWLLQQVRR